MFRLEGLWLPHVFLDVMHTKHLGADTYVAGALFAYLVVYRKPQGMTEEARMTQLWSDIKAAYQEPFLVVGGGWMRGNGRWGCDCQVPLFFGGGHL